MAYDNPIIKKRFEEKMERLNQTSLSILVSWAINNAVNSLSEEDKKNWGDRIGKGRNGQELVKERYPFFIELYREWMIDNLPQKPHWAEKQPKKAVQEEVITEVVEEEGFKTGQKQEKVEEINLELAD